MTAVATHVPAPDAPASPAQRRLTVGLCVTVVAIAFESIAVATAMPAAAEDLDGLSYYPWLFSVWVTVSAVLPAAPTWWVAIGWVLAGFGMGLTTASTALAVIWLSRVTEQGRNASSLNLSDALGSAVFVGASGTLFAALHPATDAPFTFGTVLFTMSAVALLAVATSFRITPLRDPGAARPGAPAPDPGPEQPHRVRSESATHEAAGSVTAVI